MNNKKKQTVQINKTLDTSGFECPYPLMQLKMAMQALAAGQVIEIKSTDPHSELDFTLWCERFGHQIIDKQDSAEYTVYLIKKSEA